MKLINQIFNADEEVKAIKKEEKKEKIPDIEDLSKGKVQTKVEEVKKSIPKEPIKYEVTSEGASQMNSATNLNKVDEQGSIKPLISDKTVNKSSNSIVLPPIVGKIPIPEKKEETKIPVEK